MLRALLTRPRRERWWPLVLPLLAGSVVGMLLLALLLAAAGGVLS